MKSSFDYVIDKLMRPENIRMLAERLSPSSWEYVAQKLLQTDAFRRLLNDRTSDTINISSQDEDNYNV